MRYARIVKGAVRDVFDIPNPVPYGKTPSEFATLMFPELTGWVEVPVDTANGATPNGDGTYKAPNTAQALARSEDLPVMRDKGAILADIQNLLAELAALDNT